MLLLFRMVLVLVLALRQIEKTNKSNIMIHLTNLSITSVLTAAWLPQLQENQSVEREIKGLNRAEPQNRVSYQKTLLALYLITHDLVVGRWR